MIGIPTYIAMTTTKEICPMSFQEFFLLIIIL